MSVDQPEGGQVDSFRQNTSVRQQEIDKTTVIEDKPYEPSSFKNQEPVVQEQKSVSKPSSLASKPAFAIKKKEPLRIGGGFKDSSDDVIQQGDSP